MFEFYSVSHPPKFALFVYGEKTDYRGEHTKDDLHKWLLRIVDQKRHKISHLRELENHQQDSLWVLLTVPKPDLKPQTLEVIAAYNKLRLNFDDVSLLYLEGEEMFFKMTIKKRNEKERVWQQMQPLTYHQMESWLSEALNGFITYFDVAESENFIDNKIDMMILLTQNDNPLENQELGLFQQFASKNGDKIKFYYANQNLGMGLRMRKFCGIKEDE